MIRREAEQDLTAHGDAAQYRQSVSTTGSPQRAVPIAEHKQELLQVRDDGDVKEDGSGDEFTVETTPAPLVSCGGHTASKCSLCTVIDPVTGNEMWDRGPDWCHGDCTYFDGECHRLTSQNLHTERDLPLANVSTTKLKPDLFNPEITAKDQETIDALAQKSIEEAEFEAKQRLSNEAQAEKDRKNKLIVTVIVSASSVLFLLAIASTVMLYKYVQQGQPKQLEEPLAAEDSGEDGEEGEEGEAVES
jgi:hypothetical protein